MDEKLREFSEKRSVLVEVFLAAYPRLCQEAAGRLRTLHNPADYPPADEVRSRFTFSWQYVSYGVPDQLREISARMFETERDKAVQAMSEACAEVQQVMRASLLELVSHLRDRLADQADGKAQRLRESTLQKLRDFLGTFDLRNVVDDQDLKEQVDKARALLEGVSTDALRNMPLIRARVREGMAELATQMDALAGDRGNPHDRFRPPGMESSLVGASTERLRTALQIIDAVSQGRMLFIATCNSIASLPPELRRRFTLGTFFFDLPTAEERATIWKIYLKKYSVSGELPNDEGWTGAEIKECCRKAHRLGITLAQASRYIVPVSRSAAEQIKALRQMASGKFISASTPGIYRYEEQSAAVGRRVMRELEGPVTVMPPSKSEV